MGGKQSQSGECIWCLKECLSLFGRELYDTTNDMGEANGIIAP